MDDDTAELLKALKRRPRSSIVVPEPYNLSDIVVAIEKLNSEYLRAREQRTELMAELVQMRGDT